MILARLFGRTLYVGRDRMDCPFISLARTALHPDCVCGPELRMTWQDQSYFQIWRWGTSFHRLTVEYI